MFIPESNTSTTRKDYELTFYVNDINTAYTRTLVEYDANGSMVNTFEYGDTLLARETTGGRESYLYDGRGSVANITDSSGAMVASYTYDTFGTPKLSGMSTNPYSYNAERIDRTTGLQYLRARYLDTSVGGFISQDTYLGELLKPLTQNQYIYTMNDPMNHIDPSGHWGILKSIGSAVVSGAKTVYNATVSGIKAVGSAISSGWNAVTSFVSGAISTVGSWFGSTATTIATGLAYGGAIVGAGLIGVGAAIGAYVAPMTVTQKAQAALAEVKRKFCTGDMKKADKRGVAGIAVFLDPGHGGINPLTGVRDTGATNERKGITYYESELNLKTALYVKEELESKGVKVYMSRSDDVFLFQDTRAKIANVVNADVFASIHYNSNRGFPFTAVQKGTTVYYPSGRDDGSAAVASSVSNSIQTGTSLKSKGTQSSDRIHVLNETAMPAILIEGGYMGGDIKYLSDDANIKAIASGIVQGIVQSSR